MLRFLSLLVALLVALPAWAATVSLSLGVPQLEADQTTRLTVTVVGSQPAGIPKFPAQDGVRIRFRDRRSELVSTPSTGIIKTFVYTFEATPEAPGEYVLGPAEVPMNTGTLKTGSVVLDVKPRTAADPTSKVRPLVAESRFDRETAWEGEIVLYEAILTARVPIRDVRWRLPEFSGLQDPSKGMPERTTTRIGDPAGDITIVKAVVPKVAAGTGDRTQPPAVAAVSQLTNRFSPFGLPTTRNRQEVGTEAPLRIRPLPKGPDAFSGLVGEFRLASTLSKTEKLKVGESVEWVVTIIGEGMVDGFELPELEGLEGVRVYRDESATTGNMVDGEYIGRKAFKMVLVPTERGVIELPDLAVVVFDPTEGRYDTLTAELGKLSVMGSGKALEFENFAGEGPDPAEDADPIDLVDGFTWGSAVIPPFAPVVPLLLLVALAPGFLVLTADGASAARRRWQNRRRAQVVVRGKDRLKSPPSDPVEQLAVCDLAMREALADWRGVEVGALRRDDVLQALPDTVAAEVEGVFGLLDRARFADGRAPENAVQQVRSVIDQLEKAA